MDRLELLDKDNWQDFLSAPAAVLMLGKSDCAACNAWTEELQSFLASDQLWTHIRFGKILLDQRGLIEFKRANPWLSEVNDLPFTAMYKNGQREKTFVGGGTERLLNRLNSLYT